MSRKKSSTRGGGSHFFGTTKKGELLELKQELLSGSKDAKKNAVKKIIAAMTVGKDVSSLFPDVLNCMQTADIELKKLVYLYLINYSKSNPDLAILAVNTFVRDTSDHNPLIRALAVRTMGCIRVDRITEYLCDPLRKALGDADPYVRKTAAVCVAKLFDINPHLVEEQGFLDTLRGLLSDSNPTVVANAVAALAEIEEVSGTDQMRVTKSILQKLLAALNECTEWGQVYILDSLATYTPADAREAESIVERVTPRLQHANSAVVLSAVKVILRYMDMIDNEDVVRALQRKLAPPLVTLLSSPSPEIQYVALRNISLIVQKRPSILAHEVKVFFCKYNDPIYVKMEKLEIMILLTTERNIEQVLLEFKEYATEVDVEFVRRSVRAIGRCAIKIERAAERCINVLLELIHTKVNYVVQEAVIVIKDIFRKYPNRYESIIATLCENLDTLDEPEAKAAMIWIIGEYADRIDNSDELLESFVEAFHDEPTEVQLQLLTAVVKLFLKKPTTTQELVQRVLRMATEDSDNPDLRDRGFVYWRLLSSDPNAARAVVLGERPVIRDDTHALDPALLDELISEISTLASVYHKPAETFVRMRRIVGLGEGAEEDESDESDDESEGESGEEEEEEPGATAASDAGDLLDLGGGGAGSGSGAGAGMGGLEDDLLGMGLGGGGGRGSEAAAGGAPAVAMAELLDATRGKGVRVEGAFVRRSGAVGLALRFTNVGCPAAVQQFAIQFNKNTFGLVPSNQTITLPQALSVGQSAEAHVPVVRSPARVAQAPPSLQVQMALKNVATNEVLYSVGNVPFYVMLEDDGGMEKRAFIQMWKDVDASKEVYSKLESLRTWDLDAIRASLEPHNMFFVAKRPVDDKMVGYFSCKTHNGLQVLLEITVKEGVNIAKLCVKSNSPGVAPFLQQCIQDLLRA
eukprot:CAMPEP_0196780220 /NCGR_PEP_ID=MMETSP1104-20130614/7289_1 /TAXON_ID=33652 /ORGANISM="Cafeteria sp., Strain Caron Lab Isolate" /LENGTH=919 /DNA_ID=CAMNT_0042150417 /DNA_START=40 /DNA_END=2799 /DNA_ORIENTATION=+